MIDKENISTQDKISVAHEFAQMLPLSLGAVKCARCGIETKIGSWDIKKCTEHVVSKKSGW